MDDLSHLARVRPIDVAATRTLGFDDLFRDLPPHVAAFLAQPPGLAQRPSFAPHIDLVDADLPPIGIERIEGRELPDGAAGRSHVLPRMVLFLTILVGLRHDRFKFHSRFGECVVG